MKRAIRLVVIAALLFGAGYVSFEAWKLYRFLKAMESLGEYLACADLQRAQQEPTYTEWNYRDRLRRDLEDYCRGDLPPRECPNLRNPDWRPPMPRCSESSVQNSD
jgi:hypothetical protein